MGVSVSFQYLDVPEQAGRRAPAYSTGTRVREDTGMGRAGIFFLTLKRPPLLLKLIIMSISTAASDPDLGEVSSSHEWMLGDI